MPVDITPHVSEIDWDERWKRAEVLFAACLRYWDALDPEVRRLQLEFEAGMLRLSAEERERKPERPPRGGAR